MALWRIAIATRQDEDQIEPVDVKVGALASVNQSTNCMFEVVLTLYNRQGIARNGNASRVYQPRPLLKLDGLYSTPYTPSCVTSCHIELVAAGKYVDQPCVVSDGDLRLRPSLYSWTEWQWRY